MCPGYCAFNRALSRSLVPSAHRNFNFLLVARSRLGEHMFLLITLYRDLLVPYGFDVLVSILAQTPDFVLYEAQSVQIKALQHLPYPPSFLQQ